MISVGARAKVDIVSFLRSRTTPPALPIAVDSIEEADDVRMRVNHDTIIWVALSAPH